MEKVMWFRRLIWIAIAALVFLFSGALATSTDLWFGRPGPLVDLDGRLAEGSGQQSPFASSMTGNTYCVLNEDFEGMIGWTSTGTYANYYDGATVVQETTSPDLTTIAAFFDNPVTTNYACGGWPAQGAVRYEDVNGPLREEIVSPATAWNTKCLGGDVPGEATDAILSFDVYLDLPLDNLVFYYWKVRWLDSSMNPLTSSQSDASGWVPNMTSPPSTPVAPVYYGDTKAWYRHQAEIGAYVPPGGAQYVQVALGVWDLIDNFPLLGSGACHSHAPLFDNVKIERYDPPALWVVDDTHLFQDNFPCDGTTTGTVRVDMAKNIRPAGYGCLRPGDSTVVMVTEPTHGIGIDPINGGPAVYIHVKDVSPAKSGSAISDDLSRWPVAGTGSGWTVLRMDHVYTDALRQNMIPDLYCADLSDNLYTPGDVIEFYFSATNGIGEPSYWSQFTGVTTTEAFARDNAMEMTCLPTGASDILYVDAYNGRGAQPYFDTAFEQMDLGGAVDRFDVRGSASLVGNALASRVKNVQNQLIAPYRKILWNSGDLTSGSITADDFQLLYDFLDLHPAGGGVYLSGDHIATELSTSPAAGAGALRSAYINFNFITGDHTSIGEPLSPLLEGFPSQMFSDGPIADELIAFGGGSTPNRFDVLQPAGLSVSEMENPATGASYVLSQTTLNAMGVNSRVVLSGFSYHYIRDPSPENPPARVEHLYHLLLGLDNIVPQPVGIDPVVFENRLEDNYPNPFNPTTTIKYNIAERGHVTLKIYNAAGQLIRTLVNEDQAPQANGFTKVWNGLNDRSQPVGSGVYLYQLTAKNFSQTKKMVVLK